MGRSVIRQAKLRPLRIEGLHDDRFELALDHFERGESFVFESIGGILNFEGELQIRVPTAWDTETVSERIADEELSRAERNFARLRDQSTRFRDLTYNRIPTFVLIYDYGMGGVELCRRFQSETVWKSGYPRATPAV